MSIPPATCSIHPHRRTYATNTRKPVQTCLAGMICPLTPHKGRQVLANACCKVMPFPHQLLQHRTYQHTYTKDSPHRGPCSTQQYFIRVTRSCLGASLMSCPQPEHPVWSRGWDPKAAQRPASLRAIMFADVLARGDQGMKSRPHHY